MESLTLEISQAVTSLFLFDYRSNGLSQSIFTTWSPLLQTTVMAQYELGNQHSFMEGMLTPYWTHVQQDHLTNTNDNRRSAEKCWSAILATKIWQLAHDMWIQDPNQSVKRTNPNPIYR